MSRIMEQKEVHVTLTAHGNSAGPNENPEEIKVVPKNMKLLFYVNEGFIFESEWGKTMWEWLQTQVTKEKIVNIPYDVGHDYNPVEELQEGDTYKEVWLSTAERDDGWLAGAYYHKEDEGNPDCLNLQLQYEGHDYATLSEVLERIYKLVSPAKTKIVVVHVLACRRYWE